MLLKALRVEPLDNVAVVIQDTKKGDILEVGDLKVTANTDIALGHKIAISDICQGDKVIKYGVAIGKAVVDIKCGDHVHVQNLEDITEQLCEAYTKAYLRKEIL